VEFLAWLGSNWIDVLQSFAIIASFSTTLYALRKDREARVVANSFEITKQHRDLWLNFGSRPELARILSESASGPILPAEREFVISVILHLKTAYRAIRSRLFDAPEGLGNDIRQFFSKPIPRAVWEETKVMHSDEFVSFVGAYLKRSR
jgi:hypothetical protein